MPVRHPVVAGRFYPGRVSELSAYLAQFDRPEEELVEAAAVLAPHAGYIYSGHVAGSVLGGVRLPETVLLLGPNHTGRGAPASIMGSGEWQTPLGVVPIHDALAQALISGCPHLREDTVAHAGEHSLEVMLPFLQFRRPDLRIVPISFMLRSVERIREVGEGIGAVLAKWPDPVLIVISSDMTHYESDERAREKDKLALERVLALDPEGLLGTTGRHGITMCGVIPCAITLYALRALGPVKASLVEYATSGDVSGDRASVVGYAGVRFVRV